MPTSSLTLTSYDSALAFRERALPFLMRQEAANNLPLGVLNSVIATPQHFAEAPFMATVEEEGGAVVAAFVRTPPYRLLLSAGAPAEALRLAASHLHQADVTLPGVTGPDGLSQEFGRAWTALAGGSANVSLRLRIFAVHRVQPVSGVVGALRQATRTERDDLITWFTSFAREADRQADLALIPHGVDTRLDGEQSGFWWWVVDGQPVALVGASGQTPNGIRIGPVYTPPEHRRRGYASAATAAVSQILLDAGRSFVFLFTDQANHTAMHIYQAIGYEPVCDVVNLEFVR